MIKQFIENLKGLKIAAVVNSPAEKTEKLAILCPGNLDTKDYDHLVDLAEKLSHIGYTVVRFDPIGTWESEGDASEYTITQYLDDIKCVLEYMLAEGNYNYILLGGHSRGGQMSVLYAARDPRISMVLGIMPSSQKSIKEQERKEWKDNGFRVSFRDIPGSKEKKEFRLPYSHMEDRDKYNVIEDVKKIHVPVIFITGELETIVLPEHVKMIFDSANEPKKFINIPGIGHNYRFNANEINKVNTAILSRIAVLKI